MICSNNYNVLKPNSAIYTSPESGGSVDEVTLVSDGQDMAVILSDSSGTLTSFFKPERL